MRLRTFGAFRIVLGVVYVVMLGNAVALLRRGDTLVGALQVAALWTMPRLGPARRGTERLLQPDTAKRADSVRSRPWWTLRQMATSREFRFAVFVTAALAFGLGQVVWFWVYADAEDQGARLMFVTGVVLVVGGLCLATLLVRSWWRGRKPVVATSVLR